MSLNAVAAALHTVLLWHASVFSDLFVEGIIICKVLEASVNQIREEIGNAAS